MTIGEVARRSGCSVPTVRFYESIGLIPPAARTGNGRRSYGWPDVSRLTFVRRARDFDLSIAQVKELMALERAAGSECEPAKAILSRQLQTVRSKRRELAELERSLVGMLERCSVDCCSAEERCTILSDIERAERPKLPT